MTTDQTNNPAPTAIATWDDSIRTGDTTVDGQHQELFALFEELNRSVSGSRADFLVDDVLTRLESYVDQHFRSEEELMEASDYPELSSHRQLHVAFAAETRRMVERYHQGGVLLPSALAAFLSDWLVNHIHKVDKRMVAWMQEHQRAAG